MPENDNLYDEVQELKNEIRELKKVIKLMLKGLEDVDRPHKGEEFWEAYHRVF